MFSELSFGENLSKFRTAYKVTQQTVAACIPMPLATYIDWESGRKTPPEYIQNIILEILISRLCPPNDHFQFKDGQTLYFNDIIKLLRTKIDIEDSIISYSSEIHDSLLNGRYITCIKTLPPEKIIGESSIRHIQKGSHFYIEPTINDKTLEYSISGFIYGRKYKIFKAPKFYNLRVVDVLKYPATYENYAYLDGSDLANHFVEGYINKKSVSIIADSATVYINHEYGSQYSYKAYAKFETFYADSIPGLFKILKDNGIPYVNLCPNGYYDWLDLSTMTYHSTKYSYC